MDNLLFICIICFILVHSRAILFILTNYFSLSDLIFFFLDLRIVQSLLEAISAYVKLIGDSNGKLGSYRFEKISIMVLDLVVQIEKLICSIFVGRNTAWKWIHVVKFLWGMLQFTTKTRLH